MKAAIGLVLLAACASAGSATKTRSMISAAPIDREAAFMTALATVQERFEIADASPERGLIATRPQPVTAGGDPVLIAYVVRFASRATGCGVTSAPRCQGGPLSAGGGLSVAVTPVALDGRATLPPDRVPRAARDAAADLAETIHLREQQRHVIY